MRQPTTLTVRPPKWKCPDVPEVDLRRDRHSLRRLPATTGQLTRGRLFEYHYYS